MAVKLRPKYQAGDVVKIVDDPYYDCEFGWDGGMDRYCGIETTITNAEWRDWDGCYAYYIDADGGHYAWCEGCFEYPEPDIGESDADLSVLYNM